MTTKLMLYIILSSAILFTACSGGSKPSEANAKSNFENKWQKQLKDGTVKILRFSKVNGQLGESNKIKFYKLEYEAEIEYPNGINTQCKKHQEGKTFSWDCWGAEVREKGEKRVIKDVITFYKTEKGWKAPDGTIY